MCNEIAMDANNPAAVRNMLTDKGQDGSIGEQEGASPVDAHSFRQGLSRFATGVTVITGRAADGKRVGVTVSAFCSLSLEPPLVLFCLTHESETLATVRKTGRCVINVLAEHQEPVSRAFSAQSVDWSQAEYSEGPGGLPRLAGCLAHIEGTVETIHDGGDHAIV
ncbi:MAG: flavin reductase family protein, partial [Pseudomonadota bacterium]